MNFGEGPKTKQIQREIRKEEGTMKKLLVVLFLSAFVFGCGASAQKSEFWQHDTMYKTNDHMRYSWSGYKSPTAETGKQSVEQGWWGIEIPYVPGQ